MATKSVELQSIDKKVLYILLAHLPFVAFLAPISYGTNTFAMISAVVMGVLISVSYLTLKGTRFFGILSGVFLMLFSALLIQVELGRIEMHFHIFVALAFLLIYKDWLIVLVAAGVGAVHHLVLTQMQLSGLEVAGMPIMLFNYDCSWGITFLHALFVVIESAVLIYYALLMRKEQSVADTTMNVINEIAASSDFSKRIARFEDEATVQAFNGLIASVDSAIQQISGVMEAIAKGQFNARVTDSFKGDLETLKQAVNESAESVTVTMNSLEEVMNGLSHGNLQVRMNDSIEGEFKRKVDLALEQTEELVLETVAVMSAVSKGDFNSRIRTEAEGQFSELKNNVNKALDDLQQSFTEINQASERLAEGKLNQPITREYQGELETLKNGINFAFSALSELINNVVDVNRELNVAVDEIHSGSRSLSAALESQAQQLQSTSGAFENITAGVQNSSEGAVKANDLSLSARSRAQAGVQVMQDTIESMRTIQSSSQKISEIVSLIDSIAFQTNLLALNAAVEAARAGEQGRGFAVVAGEVRNLAGKSAEAAKDIRTLIDGTVAAIDSGTGLVETSGESLTEINEAIQAVSQIISEIAESSQESARDMQQINGLIQNIDNITQDNAALATQSSSSAQTIVQRVANLTEDLNRFETASSGAMLQLNAK